MQQIDQNISKAIKDAFYILLCHQIFISSLGKLQCKKLRPLSIEKQPVLIPPTTSGKIFGISNSLESTYYNYSKNEIWNK